MEGEARYESKATAEIGLSETMFILPGNESFTSYGGLVSRAYGVVSCGSVLKDMDEKGGNKGSMMRKKILTGGSSINSFEAKTYLKDYPPSSFLMDLRIRLVEIDSFSDGFFWGKAKYEVVL